MDEMTTGRLGDSRALPERDMDMQWATARLSYTHHRVQKVLDRRGTTGKLKVSVCSTPFQQCDRKGVSNAGLKPRSIN
jgi:hypothetical protein